jgi:hypothetical protein
MWPFDRKSSAGEFGYYEFDGTFLIWNTRNIEMMCVDLSAVSAVSSIEGQSYLYLDGREYRVPAPISVLRSHWAAARANTTPIPRQF